VKGSHDKRGSLPKKGLKARDLTADGFHSGKRFIVLISIMNLRQEISMAKSEQKKIRSGFLGTNPVLLTALFLCTPLPPPVS
jgi:hypothetical protein